MGGHDPYSSSKGCAELVTKAYRDAYRSHWMAKGTAIATARAGNVIGGGDWAQDRLVPDAMRAAIAGHIIRLRKPHAIRPWQHVLEPLSGYLMLAEKLYSEGQAFLLSALCNKWHPYGAISSGKMTMAHILMKHTF
jgi:CDP-glucose 4,6-dehydratase